MVTVLAVIADIVPPRERSKLQADCSGRVRCGRA